MGGRPSKKGAAQSTSTGQIANMNNTSNKSSGKTNWKSSPLPYRFQIKPQKPVELFYTSLDLDSWANTIKYLPEMEQVTLQRVCY
jgi:hypothetical protein